MGAGGVMHPPLIQILVFLFFNPPPSNALTPLHLQIRGAALAGRLLTGLHTDLKCSGAKPHSFRKTMFVLDPNSGLKTDYFYAYHRPC